MILLMLLFAVFLAGFLGWCRAVYWQMRMDIVAEAVAISAARAQAAMTTKKDADSVLNAAAQNSDEPVDRALRPKTL